MFSYQPVFGRARRNAQSLLHKRVHRPSLRRSDRTTCTPPLLVADRAPPAHGITVVIPAYGRVEPLRRAVASVTTTHPELIEIIVVDDASPTDLASLLPDRNASGVALRCYRLHHNRGPQAARNFGIRRARFTHVALLDSDDAFLPAKMDRILGIIEQPHDLIFHAVAGLERYHRLAMLWRRHLGGSVPFDWLLSFYNPVVTPGLIFRKRILLGPPAMRHCEDYGFLLHYVHAGTKVFYLPETLSSVNRPQGASGGLSSAVWKMRKGEFRARRVLWKSPSIRNIARFGVGTILGVVRIGNDLLRGRYRKQAV